LIALVLQVALSFLSLATVQKPLVIQYQLYRPQRRFLLSNNPPGLILSLLFGQGKEPMLYFLCSGCSPLPQ
jgi:hypothetical protein